MGNGRNDGDVIMSKKENEKIIKFTLVPGPENKSGRPHIGCGNGEYCGTKYCMGYC